MSLRAAPDPERKPLTVEEVNAIWNSNRHEMKIHIIEAISLPYTARKFVSSKTMTRHDIPQLGREADEQAAHWQAVAAWAAEIDQEVRNAMRKGK